MSIRHTTLPARNEYSASQDSQVNAILLEDGDELVREINFPPSWKTARIFCKIALVGASGSEGTIGDSVTTGVRLFFGFCSKGRSFNNTTNSHAVGYYTYVDDITRPSALFWDTNENTSPPNNNVAGYFYGVFPVGLITGSVVGSTGWSSPRIARNETTYSLAHASSSYMGYSWTPVYAVLTKNSTAVGTHNISVGWGCIIGGLGNAFNIPSSIYREGMQQTYTLSYPHTVWNSFFPEIKNTQYYGNYGHIAGADLSGFNEAVYGPINCLNILWKSPQAQHIKLAVRDMVVVLTDVLYTSGSALEAPTALTASWFTTSSIQLIWKDNSSNEDGFRIERSDDSGSSWTFLKNVISNPDANGYLTSSDSPITASNQIYWYRTCAYNAYQTSSFSNTSSVLLFADYLATFSGSIYMLGSYDTFRSYETNSVPTNGGFGWDGPWSIRIPGRDNVSFYVSYDDEYSSGSVVSGSSTGEGWGSPYLL